MSSKPQIPLDQILTRRVAEIIEHENLQRQLQSGRKLRIKLGIDPTGADLHLGHAVPLMKLREFQQAGHTAVLIIGDWTARIGDPAGKDATRPPLTEAQVRENAKTYQDQAFMILDPKRTEVRMQSEWFGDIGLAEVLRLAAQVSVGQMLSHDTFRRRLDKNLPFALHELFYPLLQGYDSIAVKADVELGALEQKFNVLMGRTLQKAAGLPAQDVVLLPYLIGLDGKEKMSKSLGNYVSLTDKPDEMFGKLMSISDHLIPHYFELCTDVSSEVIADYKNQLTEKMANPRELKARLAHSVVALYAGEAEAVRASENFEIKFGKNKDIANIQPDRILHIQEASAARPIDQLLVDGGLAASKSEARRKIAEGAVDIGGRQAKDFREVITLQKGLVIRLGKRFLRIE